MHIDQFFTSDRKLLLSFSIYLSIIIAFIYSAFFKQNFSALTDFGDFPGFYVLGEILYTNQDSSLYNLDLQQKIQNQYWPNLKGSFYISVYPPYSAQFLEILALLPANIAHKIWITFSLISYGLIFLLLKTIFKWSNINTFFNSAIMLTTAPVFYGVFGGQNTMFSMLAATLILYSLRNKNIPLLNYIGGISAGLWLCKPQYGIFAILTLLIMKRYKMFLVAVSTGISLYFWSALRFGIWWPRWWIDSIINFSEKNYFLNSGKQVSLFALASWIKNFLNKPLLSYIIIFLATLLLALIIYKLFSLKNKQNAWIIFLASLPMLSPQTLFYDLTFAYFAVLPFLISPQRNKKPLLLLAFIILNNFLFFIVVNNNTFPAFSLIAILLFIFVLFNYKNLSQILCRLPEQ